MNTATRLRILEEDPLLSAQAQAADAIERHIVAACDGNALAGQIVTTATNLRKAAEVIGKLRHVAPGNFAALSKLSGNLRRLVERAEEVSSLSLARGTDSP